MGPPIAAADHALWLPDSNGIHMMFMRFAIDAVFVGAADGATAHVWWCPSTKVAGLAGCPWSAAPTGAEPPSAWSPQAERRSGIAC